MRATGGRLQPPGMGWSNRRLQVNSTLIEWVGIVRGGRGSAISRVFEAETPSHFADLVPVGQISR
jgi:hypothetical protein